MKKNKLAASSGAERILNFVLNFIIAIFWLLRSAFRFLSGRPVNKKEDSVKKE